MSALPQEWPEWTNRAVARFVEAVQWGYADLDDICATLRAHGIPNSVRTWPIPPLPADHLYRRAGTDEWAEAQWRTMVLTARAGRICAAIHERVRSLQHDTELAGARIAKAAYGGGAAGWSKDRLRAETLRLAAGLLTEDEVAAIAIPAALRGKRSARWKARRTA